MDVIKPRLPATSLAILLVLSLSLMGVGFALWSKTLVVEGVVNTGRVDARWLTAFCREFHTWPNLPTSDEDYGEAEGKEVGSTSFAIDPDDDQILHITLDNVYPSYAVDCSLKFEIDGTIPVIARGTTLIPIPDVGTEELHNCEMTGGFTKILSCDELTVIFTDNIGSQLDPGVWGIGDLLIHVEQPAEQLASYRFDVLICLAQWNEAASAEECFAAAR